MADYAEARKRAEMLLARLDRWDAEFRPRTVNVEADDLRALLAAEPAKGACADCGGCGGLGWIPAGDEQLGCIDCNGKGTIEPAPAPAPDELRKAAEGTRYATRPGRGDNRVPYCSEQCPQHDGKRCRIMGVQPSSICEPEVLNLLAALAARGGE